ncbi:MAG: hypothetical protein RR034_05130 [Bacteroidales bacterium]
MRKILATRPEGAARSIAKDATAKPARPEICIEINRLILYHDGIGYHFFCIFAAMKIIIKNNIE